MSDPPFGQLTKLAARDYWPDEAADFTPWLAQEPHIALLGGALGLELAVEGIETSVGSFQADIICRALGDEHRVVIENQLERTDHDHLGKLLTYAGGLEDVRTTILIASEIREEHRAALDWLNAVTFSGVHFFGVELQVWQIDDSPPAPHFDVVSKPNDWLGAVRTSADKPLTPTQQLQLDYWSAFRDYLLERGGGLSPRKPRAQQWASFSIGRSGAGLSAIATGWAGEGSIRVELGLHGDDANDVFERLYDEREAIEAELGPLTWHQPENAHRRRLYVHHAAELERRDAWPGQFAWFEARLLRFDDTFRDRIQPGA